MRQTRQGPPRQASPEQRPSPGTPSMRLLLRHLSWTMLIVMLATVLAPTFAWEAVAGERAHIDHSESYGDALEPQEHHGVPQRGDPDSPHQHPCAGHAFGHLAAVLGVFPSPSLAGLADEVAGDNPLTRLSHAPQVPEHPPQALPLA